MKPVLIIGTSIVHLALIFYSVGIILEQLKRRINSKVLIYVTLGVIFDIVATACMIIGSSRGLLTLHGLIGYSGLLLMLIDCVWLWRFFWQNGSDTEVTRNLHLFSRISYIWWIGAYVTGALMVFLRH
ncbi:MAG: hypothetical protein N2662_04440 [Bacteroidales bacterium]|nr:hypothetical protein [Bacteroidales bacterium]